MRQTAFCFPDDSAKSLVGESGDLRYGHKRPMGISQFDVVVRFSMLGMEPDVVTRQALEAPGVPCMHTRIERPTAAVDLITFATNSTGEGRVDNVIYEIAPKSAEKVLAAPLVIIETTRQLFRAQVEGWTVVRLDSKDGPVLLIADAPARLAPATASSRLIFAERECSKEKPIRVVFRLPQQGQTDAALREGGAHPFVLLAEARSYWRGFSPFQAPVKWQLSAAYSDFLLACGRNILQARETVNGNLTFQVGPTVYRGLWVVDGNFLLEAARYMGHDKEAQLGLETLWAKQLPDGQIFTGGASKQHWKDTGIALFTTVRQAELSQDWSYFRRIAPEMRRAVDFLVHLHEQGKAEASPNGKYGLLPIGEGDGGLPGGCAELTNTIWVLAGLKALMAAVSTQKIEGFENGLFLYSALRQAFLAAAAKQMKRHPEGFEYLPMMLQEDPRATNPDPLQRLQPQTGQWALSQCIYPGLLFERADPIVKGHIALMQACTHEDVPIETGWLPHDGLWTYNAAFVAEMYLWAGQSDWARRTFNGYLNHATPQWVWREEQPLLDTVACGYIGDMPHNWASAECVRYLRHAMALEDGPRLRLLEGIGQQELARDIPVSISGSPTRFGRIHLALTPLAHPTSWRIDFRRDAGPDPESVSLPGSAIVAGAKSRVSGRHVLVEGSARSWSATWQVT